MQESGSAGDIFAVIFILVFFLVLFGIPIWLMVRHYKKSKPKIAAEKEAYNRQSSSEKEKQKKVGYANLAGATGLVIGIFIGSRLQLIVLGVVMGALFGGLLRYATEKVLKV